jgi:hypothetical protein
MAYQHQLPKREVFAVTQGCFVRHDRANLRRIANEFDIKNKKRMFYDRAWDLANDYSLDRIIEGDLLGSTDARRKFRRAIDRGTRFLDDIEAIFSDRATWWIHVSSATPS